MTRLGALLSLSILALGSAARAQSAPEAATSRTSSLSWVRLPGAERCAPAQELARAVETRLAREVFVAPRGADLSVEGRVAPREAGGYTATFSVATADGQVLGERELETEAEDCVELLETVAFVVAVMIDPDAEAEAGTGTVPAAHATEGNTGEGLEPADQQTGSAPTASAQQAETEPASWSGEIDAGLGLGVGILPEPALGGFGAIVLQTPWFVAFELGGSLYPHSPQSTFAGDANWLALFGSILVCTASFEWGGFGVRGCVGGELGFVHISGVVDPSQDHIAGHVLFRARLSYRIWRGLVVWTRPTLAINPRSDPFVFSFPGGSGHAHSPETVAGIFDLGLGWIFD